MQLSRIAALSALTWLPAVSGLNIMLGNDDGFGSANLREVYRLLKTAGHNTLMVAPSNFQSGKGGTSVYADSGTLYGPSEYDLVPAGSPSLGTDPADSMIWYYNGTPAACAVVGLDWVVPKYTNWTHVDLVIAGPNFGNNLGNYLYTLSGTNGYTYTSVGKGVPGIAFSAGNSEQRSYKWINETTPTGFPDPATLSAQLVVGLVEKLARATPNGSALMPPGYGLSVNFPKLTSLQDDSCIAPPFIQTRMTGGAEWDTIVYNETTKTFKYGDTYPAAGNRCINGNCLLPGESDVLDNGCQSSVSVFTVDYDAPVGKEQDDLRSRLFPLVEYFPNSTTKGYGKRETKGKFKQSSRWTL
ncbi:5'/3'-nucleotidase sure [Polychaeton citri CBS 116435]|uniref:5'/3'-nucleotidase sure n=1 Tax=Polychaeton citri CBS 116435 TaxID=1314669 RepID=A0A9P4QA76_9PEZI|nr:5'/3'-nucleotidase sure [Polychaeton citri CBS 116435]